MFEIFQAIKEWTYSESHPRVHSKVNTPYSFFTSNQRIELTVRCSAFLCRIMVPFYQNFYVASRPLVYLSGSLLGTTIGRRSSADESVPSPSQKQAISPRALFRVRHHTDSANGARTCMVFLNKRRTILIARAALKRSLFMLCFAGIATVLQRT